MRTRLVSLFDDRVLSGALTINRLRAKLLCAFGPRQRFATSLVVPVLHASAPATSASGLGDAEVSILASLEQRERYRLGNSFQTALPTASNGLLGGVNTMIRPSLDVAAVISPRIKVTGVLYYRQSVQVARGAPVRQFELDVTVNARVVRVTWFGEWDAFYEVTPGQLAQTLRTGFSRSFDGSGGPCPRTTPLNNYGRDTQSRRQRGLDLTWYPWAGK